MKNIQSCTKLEKYSASDYNPVSDGIYSHHGEYVTALPTMSSPRALIYKAFRHLTHYLYLSKQS